MAGVESVKGKLSKYLSLASQVLAFLTKKNTFVSVSPGSCGSPQPRSPSGLATGRAFPALEMSESFKKKIEQCCKCLFTPISSHFGHFPARLGGSLRERHHIRAGQLAGLRPAGPGEERSWGCCARGAGIRWAGRRKSEKIIKKKIPRLF